MLGLSIGIGLGVLFLVVQCFEWRNKTFSLSSGLYGSIYFVTTGFHMAHVVVGLLILSAILGGRCSSSFTPPQDAPAYWGYLLAFRRRRVAYGVFYLLSHALSLLTPMTTADSVGSETHPAPARGAVPLPLLTFGVVAGPAVWIFHLTANAVLAAHGCARGVIGPATSNWGGTRFALVGIDAVALVVALASAGASLWCWRAVRGEHGGTGDVAQVGEGRTRFIAMCGLMTGLGFAVAILFDAFAAIMVPRCSG